jgi:hypothetical protein
MAANLKQAVQIVSEAIQGVMAKSGDQYYYDDGYGRDGVKSQTPLKRMKVSVAYDNTREDGRWALISSLDTKTGKADSFYFEYPLIIPDVVRAIEKRDGAAVRVFKTMKTLDDAPGLWLQEWKAKRCLHRGVPNACAMLLLTGLRKPLRMGWLRTKEGQTYKGGNVSKLYWADLLRITHSKDGDRDKATYTTNYKGYEVLKHWASRSKLFDGYLQAFLPKDWEENELAISAFNAMHGKVPDVRSANAPSRYYTVGAAK